MNAPRIGAAVSLLGALLLLLVWRTVPALAPPLYDGLLLPPERYRYVQPPQGSVNTKPPTSAHATITLSGPSSPLMVASTQEKPPQAQLILEDNAVPARLRLASVTLTIKPIVPPSVSPGGKLDSNVYAFGATTPSGSPVQFAPKATVSVQLRPAGLPGRPVIEHFVNGEWVTLPTHHFVSIPYYSTDVRTLGTYALITPQKATSSPPWTLFAIVAIVVLLAVMLLLLIRLSRMRTVET